MPLTVPQIIRLAREIDEQWNIEELKLFTSDNLGINLDNIAPEGGLKDRAIQLIASLNTNRPRPRDREFLEKLRICPNARLRQVADELLTPNFFAPNDDPHDAIMLGEYAFVDRAELRTKLRDFTSPSHYTTRVLVVRGLEPCGKSYSWQFLSQRQARARHHPGAPASDLKTARPSCSVHVESAPRTRADKGSRQPLSFQFRSTSLFRRTAHPPDPREKTGLGGV